MHTARGWNHSLALGMGTLMILMAVASSRGQTAVEPLPNTAPLTMAGDITSELVAGVDRFLLKRIESSVAQRARHWKRDFSSVEAYGASIEPNRRRLAHILGVRDPRVPFDNPRLVGTIERPDLLASAQKYNVLAVRWPAFGDVSGEGLLLEPGDRMGVADIVVIPDADTLPEQLAGLVPGLPPEEQIARRLAESGARVIVPVLIDRTVEPRFNRAKLTSREFIYRPAFELGRHIIGYEVQKVLALVDWLSRRVGDDKQAKIGVYGQGEGGGIALYAAALDPRIDAAAVSGYFDNRNSVWTQPIDRNVFGLLDEFGDAELASMVAPRALIIEAAKGPEFVFGPKQGGGPGTLTSPTVKVVNEEFERAGR